MILGPNVYLRAMEQEDIPWRVKWLNDDATRKMLHCNYLIGVESTKQWLRAVTCDMSRRDFIICECESDRPIGYSGFRNIDFYSRKAEMYMAVGEKDCRGKGYGTESKKLLLRYAFMDLSLNKLYEYNWIENKPIISLNKKLGFKVEGTLIDDVLSHGEYRTNLVMALLRREYEQAIDLYKC